jgi:hypothetical protein
MNVDRERIVFVSNHMTGFYFPSSASSSFRLHCEDSNLQHHVVRMAHPRKVGQRRKAIDQSPYFNQHQHL